MESFLCNLIVTGAITDAKIHRPSRVVNLRARKANLEQLDQWASNVHKLTETLNKVSVNLAYFVFEMLSANRTPLLFVASLGAHEPIVGFSEPFEVYQHRDVLNAIISRF